jgi:cell fate (sporulation/competence/biofilm development) regulator YlbF (YheA/YmcA/DUF963 family)
MSHSIIEKANELGKLIREDERCNRLLLAEFAANNDIELQKKIMDFNGKRDAMMEEMAKSQEGSSAVEAMNQEVKGLYEDIMGNPVMAEYTQAKQAFDDLMNEVNQTISFNITGGDSGCAGSCSTCPGCHG